eukprot:TRINITY_DN4661_c0_g1_i2.p1 TRINITY_DN4661_c0_g1~~TRINITY_DN4661_c0_g1_i2.p1  ORF type:complete len:225 (+),score=58.64 TRINITY_DN4661_c0_g1_i2:45-719(+)
MFQSRLKRELEMLEKDPPQGVSAWLKEDRLDALEANIEGPPETPYERGVFRLDVVLSQRYPMEPPKVSFVTPIYHPNIDEGGRICLDTLNMPPKGAWTPSLNIPTLLTSIRLLMAHPNPDDGLMSEITQEYRHNRAQFDMKARGLTLKHAIASSKSQKTKESAGETSTATATATSTSNKSSLTSSSDSKSKEIDERGGIVASEESKPTPLEEAPKRRKLSRKQE